MKFAPERLAEAREILSSMIERTRVCPGCLGCNIFEDLLDPRIILLEECWKTKDDLDRHLRSDLYRRIILVMEMAAEFPAVKFSEITKTTGIETLRNSRYGLSLTDPIAKPPEAYRPE